MAAVAGRPSTSPLLREVLVRGTPVGVFATSGDGLVAVGSHAIAASSADGSAKLYASPIDTSGPSQLWWEAADLSPQGQLLAVGRTSDKRAIEPTPARIAIARYDADGRLDAGFGAGGLVLIPQVNKAGDRLIVPTAVAVQPDGRVLVAGFAKVDDDSPERNRNRVVAFRLQRNGQLDTAFGRAGFVLLGQGEHLTGMGTVQVRPGPEGSATLMATAAGSASGQTVPVAWLARLDGKGQRITSFGQRGHFAQGAGAGAFMPFNLRVTADGSHVVVGMAIPDLSRDEPAACGVLKIDAQGRLAAGFGSDGWVVYREPASEDCRLVDLHLAADRSLLVAGYTRHQKHADGAQQSFFIRRLPETGALDAAQRRAPPSFTTGSHGLLSEPAQGAGPALAVRASGRVVALLACDDLVHTPERACHDGSRLTELE